MKILHEYDSTNHWQRKCHNSIFKTSHLDKISYQTCSYHFHLSLKKKKQLISKRAYNFKIMSLHMCLIKYKKCDISRFKYHMYGTKIVANPH